MQDDKKCPDRNKECLKCHKVGHFAKWDKTKETKCPKKKCPSKPKGHEGTVNQMNFKDYSDDKNEYAFTAIDEKQPMVLVSIGGVPNVSMTVDSGASCNVIDRLCVDIRKANSAIVREQHPIPTLVNEILHNLKGSTVFTKLDIKLAFHQVE